MTRDDLERLANLSFVGVDKGTGKPVSEALSDLNKHGHLSKQSLEFCLCRLEKGELLYGNRLTIPQNRLSTCVRDPRVDCLQEAGDGLVYAVQCLGSVENAILEEKDETMIEKFQRIRDEWILVVKLNSSIIDIIIKAIELEDSTYGGND